MHIVGELTIDYTTFRRITMAGSGRIVGWLRLFGLLALLMVAASALVGSSFRFLDFLSIIGGFMLVTMYDVLIVIAWRRASTLVEQPWRYEITDSFVKIHTAQTDVSLQWDGISKIRTGRHAWVFTLGRASGAVPIPRAAFSAENQEQIDKLAEIRRS
ncbi:YcxB family protein [Frankia sp. Cas4]|uniref:YcxB family protein n=1 Tax=Frankia sp. Cas4 TaxID=3073927 RepID=UPI002AD2504E|nr:YcxB family protein [Frankia sp. Cas4]